MKFANKRTTEQKEQDYELEARLCAQGLTHLAITAKLNARENHPYTLSRQQVEQDIQKIEKRWQAAAVESINVHKGRLLNDLYQQRRELWAEWERSKLDNITQSADIGSGGTGAPRENKRVVKRGQCGDVSYQNALIAINDRIAKLLGADAPIKTELAGPNGGPVDLKAMFEPSEAEKAALEWFKARKEGPTAPTPEAPAETTIP